MGDVANLLEAIEKLAYKILVWIILIPKTLWHIVVKPAWVPGYINVELKKEKSAFDEFVSPIILILVVALIPILILLIQPMYNLAISSPAETTPASGGDSVEFDAEATFISASAGTRDRYTWYVERIPTDEETGEIIYDEFGYPKFFEIYREIYDEATEKTIIIDHDIPLPVENGEAYTHLTRDKNYSKDEFYYSFEPGYYYVNVEVTRFNIDRGDIPLEEYGGDGEAIYVVVYVPENQDESISITSFAKNSEKLTWEDLYRDKNTILIIAIILMTPPLFFSFAIKAFTKEKISESSLLENFYIQCYYFSPLFLTFWASFYGFYFYTIDIFSYDYTYMWTMFLPLIWALLWFIYAETKAVALALKTSGWLSFIVVVICISVVIGLAGCAVFLISDTDDTLRKGLIWAYPLVFHLALSGLILFRLMSWFSGKKRLLVSDVIIFILFIPSIIFFVRGNLLGMTASPDRPTQIPTPIASFSSVLSTGFINDTTVTPIPTATALIPTETSTLVTSPTLESNPTTYVIHRGEFPYCIARRFNIHPAQLLASSGLADGQGIHEGTILNIPQGGNPFPGNRSLRYHPTTFIVSSLNETLYSIACRFGDVDPTAIARSNGISISTPLTVGQHLNIP